MSNNANPANAVPTRISRFILGFMDPEMRFIKAAVANHCPGIEVLTPVTGRDDPYSVAIAPQTGDVWIECAPAEGGKAAVKAAGGTVIDHHQPGDAGYGVTDPLLAYQASSAGQFCALAIGLGVIVAQDGEEVLVGEADHNFPAFIRGQCSTPAAEALRFHAKRSGVTVEDIEAAQKVLFQCPTLGGVEVGSETLGGVVDARGEPSLSPATMTAQGPVKGTGGFLGAATFLVASLPGATPVLNWGAQGTVPGKGRHVGILGDTALVDCKAILTSIGATGIYGQPGRAWGGYIPV
jgi:hypothetical protein